MATQLTTPQSETVTQYSLVTFGADLDTNTFYVKVRLTNADETIVRERAFGGDLPDLGLAGATVQDIRAKLVTFLRDRGVVN